MKQSVKTALGGIIAAISVALMFCTSVIPFLTYALPAVCGALLTIIVIEINRKWAFCVYAVVSILSLLVVVDKEAAVMYTFFFGYYPIIKSLIESKLPKIPEYIIKLLIFNAAVVSGYCVATYVLGVSFDEMDDFGKYTSWILLGVSNPVFILYDIALTRVITLYIRRSEKLFKKLMR
ncbi:MAG: hypothetical protein GX051_02025 [Clostridiales bacterium]|nr:hypothetical protein [Clostridiales bacterium]